MNLDDSVTGFVNERQQYIADFETTTDASDCRVWLWALCDIRTLDIEHGIDIKSFIQRISREDSYIWFHNLAFDGVFILDYMLKRGYEHTIGSPLKGELSTLISNTGKFYCLKIKWHNGNFTEIRDSIKKIPMSVSAMSDAFHIEQIKGSIDYNALRPIGYQPTEHELEYVHNDVLIVAQAVRHQLSLGLTKLTVGADALAEFQSLTGNSFRHLFPLMSLEEDAEIRRAYRGGFTYADPRYSKKVQGCGKVFDVNSLYPYVMRTQKLPFGLPEFSESPPQDNDILWVGRATIIARIKPGHIPCIQIKSSHIFSSTEYQTTIDEPVDLSFTNIDYQLWQKHYDLTVLAWSGVWSFQGATGLFDKYIDKWSKVKETSTGGIKVIAKLQLNSLYGKFGTNPNVTGKLPIIDNDSVRYIAGELTMREPIYTPVAVFVTAYARSITITAAQANYDRFAYADTDSLHLLGHDNVDLDIHPSRIGSWKHEGDFVSAYYLRAKAYTENMIDSTLKLGNVSFFHTKMETHVAGLPREAAKQVRYTHYETKTEFGGKLSPKKVPGGVVLVDIGFTLTKGVS